MEVCAVRKCLSFLVMIILPVWEEGRSPTECFVKLRVRGRRISRQGWEYIFAYIVRMGSTFIKVTPSIWAFLFGGGGGGGGG